MIFVPSSFSSIKDYVDIYIHGRCVIFCFKIYDWENEVVKMNAYSFCENYIRENEVGKLCSMIPGVDFRQQVNTCMEDIKVRPNQVAIMRKL